MECDLVQEYKEFVLKKGTVLYNGSCMPWFTANSPFWAFHPLGKSVLDRLNVNLTEQQMRAEVNRWDSFVFFATTSEGAAKNYGNVCGLPQSGMINQFVTKRDIHMLLDPHMAGEDTSFVYQCICKQHPKFQGYAVVYSDTEDEFAFCGAEQVLQFRGSLIFNGITFVPVTKPVDNNGLVFTFGALTV
jgi:hypothetical protein